VPKDHLDLDNYSESLLKEMIPPKQVSAEFGVPTKTLEYMRDCSIDEGKLRGPLFFKDENIILYPRRNVIVWLKTTMFSPSETQETQQSQKTKKETKRPKLVQ
jgi:hypothetical protein